MRLTTKGRLAVTAMVDLALTENSAPVPLATLCVRHGISLSYLEQLFSGLRKHQLVRSTRGPGGGYRLARDSMDISVADIIVAVDAPSQRSAHWQSKAEKSTGKQRVDGVFWSELNRRILDLLSSVSLGSLAAEQKARGVVLTAPESPRKAVAVRPLPPRPMTTAPNSVFALAQKFAR
ncbi:MAG: Rrf2 family transcriptional regulator [Gammaproteobacteria bacterium]|jgi:Rrf2 family iron-sulfur cluster assembly transcriptional regulator|nr:Rrf2 family transcriptional regulator [Gammaproteobacteria bacterium]MBU0787895.1 Rrf2 family transcriptional regulator [Gammaproteobacteria bacterium]MBU0816988.1 Rrf2 family transcriptional regulator [Gammaproteobacteria bacterium]MBU1787152.1 Rrf2 family transcriptional regulator [Gammaproteobacteria bacterium]